MIYDANRISIEGDTQIAFTEDVAKRYEAYGWHVQTSTGPTTATTPTARTTTRTSPRCGTALDAAEDVTDKPSLIVLSTIIAWPAPDAQNTEASHGSALGDEEVAATKKVLGFDPDKTFEVPDEVHRATPGPWSTAARSPKRPGTSRSPPGRAANPERDALLQRLSVRSAARRLGRRAAVVPRRRRRASPPGSPPARSSTRSLRTSPSSGAGLPTSPGPTTPHQGRAERHPRRVPDLVLERQPVRPGAALRHPRARHGLDHERHHAARRHPRLRRHLPGVLRLHAAGRPPRGADAAAHDLRLDPRLDRPRRGRTRPTSRSSTSLRCGRSRASTSSGPPTPTRPWPPGRRSSSRPTARSRSH